MSRSRRDRRSSTEPPEINITAFLNLMVVLIPFLLLSAAFNQITMLELYLPAPGYAQNEPADNEKKFELQIVIRENSLLIQDKNNGPIKTLPVNADGSYDINGMQRQLAKVKSTHKDVTRITLLSEPQITYEKIVLIMDNVRTFWIDESSGGYLAELFPDISVGEAPEAEG